jgi:hypothetical protein
MERAKKLPVASCPLPDKKQDQGTRHKVSGARNQESGIKWREARGGKKEPGWRAIDTRGRADEMRPDLLKIVVNSQSLIYFGHNGWGELT